MGKSTVERYEDVAADASSTAFLELAKELIETGEPLRAIEVCRTGLAQLPNCIAARVLWGKALIQCRAVAAGRLGQEALRSCPGPGDHPRGRRPERKQWRSDGSGQRR